MIVMAAEINSVIGTKRQSGCRLCAGVVDNVRKCWYCDRAPALLRDEDEMRKWSHSSTTVTLVSRGS